MKKLCWAVLLCVASAAAAQTDSIAELTRKAEGGNAEAQFQLGLAYDDGNGIPQDPELAAKWYRKSAEQGNASAQNNLGVLYRQGQGVPDDKKEAARWFRLAAQQCNPNGAYNLGIAYYNGDGVVTDPGLAFAWLVIAKQCGNSNVQEAMNRISAEMTIKQREIGESKFVDYVLATPEFKPDVDQLFQQLAFYNPSMTLDLCQTYAKDGARWFNDAKASYWCQQAVAHEEFGAYEVLGNLAEKRSDFKEAVGFYLKAADYSTEVPARRLGILLLEGKGIQPNTAEAYFWLYMAVTKNRDSDLKAKLEVAGHQISRKERKNQEKRVAAWIQQHSQ